MTKTRLTLIAVALCGLLLPFAGCDSAENPIAPSNSVLFITANPTEIGLNGSSTITVTGFKPDNNPLNPGTLITLSTSIGILEETVLQTDSEGRVSTTLRGNGVAGTATVQAQVSGGGGTGGGGGDGEGGGTGSSSGATASTSVQIGDPEGSQPTVVITANPSIITVGGRSTINVLGRGADGNPVTAGERVRLTADLGRLTCQSPFICPGESSSPCDAVCTDANGEAEATFIAGDRSGDGVVRAILGTSAEEMVTININAALESLTLTASRRTIQRDPDGETIDLEVLLLDSLGSPIRALVRFSTGAGTFSSNQVNADSDGLASTTLTVTALDVQTIPENGTFTITARATAEGVTREDSVDVTVLGAP